MSTAPGSLSNSPEATTSDLLWHSASDLNAADGMPLVTLPEIPSDDEIFMDSTQEQIALYAQTAAAVDPTIAISSVTMGDISVKESEVGSQDDSMHGDSDATLRATETHSTDSMKSVSFASTVTAEPLHPSELETSRDNLNFEEIEMDSTLTCSDSDEVRLLLLVRVYCFQLLFS